MLSFANLQVLREPPPELRAQLQEAHTILRSRRTDAASAYGAASAADASRPPPRAADTVAVKPLLLDMDRDHLAAFSALGEKTRNRLTELHEQGLVSTRTVTSALDLALTDVRQRRYTEDRTATLTDAEKDELAAIRRRRDEPRLRSYEETRADILREQEIWLDTRFSESVKAQGGLPIPAGHPGVHIATGAALLENQTLRDLGVDIARDPGFESRLMDKLRAGEIAQTGPAG